MGTQWAHNKSGTVKWHSEVAQREATDKSDRFVVFVFDCPTGAAGRHTGILADDSAVSSDLPKFMMIPGK